MGRDSDIPHARRDCADGGRASRAGFDWAEFPSPPRIGSLLEPWTPDAPGEGARRLFLTVADAGSHCCMGLEALADHALPEQAFALASLRKRTSVTDVTDSRSRS